MNRTAKARRSLGELADARRWHDAVVADGCLMCRYWPSPVDPARRPELARLHAHHVLPKAKLKNEGLHDFLWVEGNGICLCEFHHTRHHNFTERVPRSLVTRAEPFADEHGLRWMLDWEYRHERLSR